MVSDAQKRAAKRYDKKQTIGKYLKLNRITDADIIEHLKSIDNFQGYIKDLIRNDLKIKSHN